MIWNQHSTMGVSGISSAEYDIFTEKMAGAEALVRWVHPVKGYHSAG